MKKWELLLALMLVSVSTWADGLKSQTFRATGTSAAINLLNTGIAYHKLTWNVTGTVSACSVELDSSTDGKTWTPGGVITGQDCTSNGASSVVNMVVNYVRIDMATFTGTGSVNVTWNGYVNNPGGGGGGIGGTVSSPHIPYASGADTLSDSGFSYSAPGGIPTLTVGACNQAIDGGNDIDFSGCPTFTINGVGSGSAGLDHGTFFFNVSPPAIGVDFDDMASHTFWQTEIEGMTSLVERVGSGDGMYTAKTCWSGTSLVGSGACWGTNTANTALVANEPLESTGTAATLTGTAACLTGDLMGQVGGAFAGKVQCTNTTGASTLIIAPGATAPNGWVCYGSDLTTAVDTIRQSETSTTTCTLAGTVNANDVLTFVAVAF